MRFSAIVFDGPAARRLSIASHLTNLHFSVRSYGDTEGALDTLRNRAGSCDLAVTTDSGFARSVRAVAPPVSVVLIEPGKGSAPQLVGPGFAVAHSASEGALTTAISMVLGERIRSAVAAF